MRSRNLADLRTDVRDMAFLYQPKSAAPTVPHPLNSPSGQDRRELQHLGENRGIGGIRNHRPRRRDLAGCDGHNDSNNHDGE